MQKQTLATVASRTAKGDEPEITISTIALDRDQDEVVPEGGDFASYLKNPVVGFGHFRQETIPVGVTTAIDVVPGCGIKARWRWLENDPFASRVRNAFEQGVLRAASIGFLPTGAEPNGQGGSRFTRWSLLEWSLVPIPANPEAVRSLKAAGLWRDDEFVLDVERDEPGTLEIDDAFAARLRSAVPVRRHSEPFEPIYDVHPEAIRGALRDALRESVGALSRELVTATIARMRGRVD